MKYKGKEGNWSQIWNRAIEILNDPNRKIPYSTRWLYITLHLLEHRFCGEKEDFFFRRIKDLVEDSGISYRLVIKGIKTLKELKLIETWQMHWWVDKERRISSQKHVTAFRILEPPRDSQREWIE